MSIYPTLDQLDKTKSLEGRFSLLDNSRRSRLYRCREFSQYTIPRLFPHEDMAVNSDLPELFSSYPGRLCAQLAAKLMAAVFPLNDVPFFNFVLPQDIVNEDGTKTAIPAEQYQGLVDSAAGLEKDIMDRLRSSNLREALQSVFEHAIILADVMLYQDSEYNFRVYRVDQFVLRRDAAGNIAEMMIRDWLEPDLLNDTLKNLNQGKAKSEVTHANGRLEPHYTHLRLRDGKWDVQKEFREVVYEKDVSYKNSPYYHVGWARVFTEDYSRSLVEENFGAIRSLEFVEKALVEGIAASSKGFIGVDPTGLTKIEDLEMEDNWQFSYAREQDIYTFQPNATTQVGFSQAYADSLKATLDAAFLANQASRLTGERVTAFQVQESVAEMQQALGGVLGQVAAKVQRPIVMRSLDIERKQGRLTDDDMSFLEEYTSLQVKTGLDALGRQMEGARLQALEQMAMADPELAAELNTRARAQGLVVSSGLDFDIYGKSLEQKQQEQEAALAQQAAQQGVQQGIQSVGRIAEQQAQAEQ